MEVVRWVGEHGASLIQSLGIILGLLFTAAALRAETRSRQVENLIRITEGHRALWTYFDERPELSRLFHLRVDLAQHPLTAKESRFVQFLINHIFLTFRAQHGGLLQAPERLGDDIRSFFSLPIPRAVWDKVRRYQDEDFRRFMEESFPRKGGMAQENDHLCPEHEKAAHSIRDHRTP